MVTPKKKTDIIKSLTVFFRRNLNEIIVGIIVTLLGGIMLYIFLPAGKDNEIVKVENNTGDEAISPYPKNKSSRVGIMYHNQLSYALKNPSGWILDSWSKPFKSSSMNVLGCFYPENRTLATTNSFVYTFALDKSDYENTSFDEFVKNDIKFNIEVNHKTVLDGGFYITQNDATAIVKYFFDENINEYIGVAYIDAPKNFIMICLFSKASNIFFNSLKPFSEIVKSCDILKITMVYPKNK
jgi:hypothetical protein